MKQCVILALFLVAAGGQSQGVCRAGRERMHLPKRQILMMLRVVWNTINAYTLSPTRLFAFGAGVDFNETQLERDRGGPPRGGRGDGDEGQQISSTISQN